MHPRRVSLCGGHRQFQDPEAGFGRKCGTGDHLCGRQFRSAEDSSGRVRHGGGPSLCGGRREQPDRGVR